MHELTYLIMRQTTLLTNNVNIYLPQRTDELRMFDSNERMDEKTNKRKKC